jgi:hypothetical protein
MSTQPQTPTGWTLRDKLHAFALVIITAAAIGHQLGFYDWFIEDAAISFAYARNLADGEGLVAFAGGERVEGYSNPTWVLLIAVFELFGVDGFVSSKWLAGILAGLTVPLTYLIAREAWPNRRARDAALVAPIALAGHSQFAQWGASGLENSLFSFLMALGLWRLFVELRTGRWPWSAFVFFLLAITRPEAIMYGAVAGFSYMVFTLGDRRGPMPTLKWLFTFYAPFAGYHAARYSYFAWEFPNTYYAKLNLKDPAVFNWNHRGWKYVRNWAHALGHAYLLPVYLIGLTGSKGWRVMAAVAGLFAIGLSAMFTDQQRLLLPLTLGCTYAMFYASYRNTSGKPGRAATLGVLLALGAVVGLAELMRWFGMESNLPAPSWWAAGPPYAMFLVALGLPIASARSEGWKVRVVCWAMCAAAIFFAVYAVADWMKNWRWMSLLAVPQSVLFAAGVGAVAELLQDMFSDRRERWGAIGWVTAVVGAGAILPANIYQSNVVVRDTTPFSVKKRVEYMTGVARTLHMDERVRCLDVDQGAHLFWSGFEMLDIAGLVDLPMAHHKFERPFIQEYIFQEQKPHFAHVHAGWAANSKIPTHPEWRRDYVEVPGYPAGNMQFHVGNHVRKDLIVQPVWKAPTHDRHVDFGDKIELEGWHIPSPLAAKARLFYLEAGWDSRNRKKNEDFRVVAFIADDRGNMVSWNLEMGYGWYPPHQWGPREVFHGKHSLAIPAHLPEGTYDLGFVVFAADGSVVPVAQREPETDDADDADDVPTIRTPPPRIAKGALIGGRTTDPVMAEGEVRFEDALQVGTVQARDEASESALLRAEASAAAGECDTGAYQWWQARMYRPRDRAWAEKSGGKVRTTLAQCFVGKAAQDPDHAVEHLLAARKHDRKDPALLNAADVLSDTLYQRGSSAYDEERWDDAYAYFAGAMRVKPTHAWARRYAELARARNLGIDEDSKQAAEADRLQRQEDLRRKREEAAAKRAKQGAKTDGERPASKSKTKPAPPPP